MSKNFMNVLKTFHNDGDGVINRDTYLNTAFAGQPPAQVGAELESEFPQHDARFMAFPPTTHEEVRKEQNAKKAKQEKK